MSDQNGVNRGPIPTEQAPQMIVGVFQAPNGSIAVMWAPGITPKAALRKLVTGAEDLRDFIRENPEGPPLVQPVSFLGKGVR